MPARTGPDLGWVAAALLWAPSAGLLLASGRGGFPLWPGPVAVMCSLLGTVILTTRRSRAAREERLAALAAWRAVAGELVLDEPEPPADADAADVMDRVRQLASRAGAARAQAARQALAQAVVLEALPIPVLSTDARGVVLWANRSAAEHFRDRGAGPVGRRIDELFTSSVVLALHAKAVAGQAGAEEVRVPSARGVRVLEVGASPTGPAPSPGVVLSIRDVTDLSVAVQLRTDFVANASHELRTPLASIRGAIETLEGGAWEDPAMRERLARMIATNVVRLEELVRDLLDLSRLESQEGPAEVKPVRASEVASEVKAELADQAGHRRVAIRVDLDPGLESMRTDRRLVSVIIRNLVENAVKFAFEGTEVRLEGRVVANPGGRAGARFRVVDRGIGIPIEHQQRIFERFFQVGSARHGSPAMRGTGLGLAIVRHAVRTLGGTVGVESVWQQGTTMTVDLPACVEAEA
ncbi:MAG: PAS domain-containing protein [Leptolyngbya sp. PLA1]|nr:PAS domain-containing protein [Leptolyngbya sp. PLA1]